MISDRQDSEPSVPQFDRLIVGGEPMAVHFGGAFHVLSIELYDRLVAVNWRLAPLPDVRTSYPRELAQHVDDSLEFSESERKGLRTQFENMLRTTRCFDIGLHDDRDQQYRVIGGSASGTTTERIGRTRFEPTVGEDVSQLFVEFGGRAPVVIPV